MVLSQSRTAMVAGAICVLAYVAPRARWKSFLAIPPLILMVYAIAPYKWQVTPDGGGRISLWLDTLNGITFFGHGIGSFYSAFIATATHIDTFHYQPDTAHNDLLQFAFELGIPATFLAVALLLVLWKVAGETERIILLAFAIIGLLAFPLYNPATAAVFALVAGYSSRNWDNLRRPMVRSRYSLHPWRGQAYYDRIGESVEPVSVLS
jgi:O-antigen ligase